MWCLVLLYQFWSVVFKTVHQLAASILPTMQLSRWWSLGVIYLITCSFLWGLKRFCFVHIYSSTPRDLWTHLNVYHWRSYAMCLFSTETQALFLCMYKYLNIMNPQYIYTNVYKVSVNWVIGTWEISKVCRWWCEFCATDPLQRPVTSVQRCSPGPQTAAASRRRPSSQGETGSPQSSDNEHSSGRLQTDTGREGRGDHSDWAKAINT